MRDSDSFKGLAVSKQREVNDIIENEQKNQFTAACGSLGVKALADVRRDSASLTPLVLDCFRSGKPLIGPVRDQIINMATGMNMVGQDPTTTSRALPNLYISPNEAATIYSQKGLPETIIQKKSQSVRLNGVKIKNPKFTPEQNDKVAESVLGHALENVTADALRDALTFGGSLAYPVFKKDTPMTMHLPVSALIRAGIVGKGCIDRYTTLDRWNCVHVPNWNPTESDFLFPKWYYIPFLGTEVSGSRCARIVPAPQAGYWGTVMTMGWGVSDIIGWIESVYDYYNVMKAVPTMIAQMSIIVRTFNVDPLLAMEGMNVLNDVDMKNTAVVRESSVNNPIDMDIMGDIKAIQRNFAEVPALVRLVRQHVGNCTNVPEELLWSSERGAFSSGDQTEGALEKQWENVKYTHKTVGCQLKNIALFEVINALGLDRDVMSILPYTTIEFDNPIIVNAATRASIASELGACAFDLTASGMPSDAVMQIVNSYGNDEFAVRSDILIDLKNRQAKIDEREDTKFKKEMELMDAQIESAKSGAKVAASGGAKGEGYSRLEQHKKEKTRGTSARREGQQKAAGKKLG